MLNWYKHAAKFPPQILHTIPFLLEAYERLPETAKFQSDDTPTPLQKAIRVYRTQISISMRKIQTAAGQDGQFILDANQSMVPINGWEMNNIRAANTRYIMVGAVGQDGQFILVSGGRRLRELSGREEGEVGYKVGIKGSPLISLPDRSGQSL